MKKSAYSRRIQIPINGNQETIFFTKSKLKVATGYEKILLGGKPKIQFLVKNVCVGNLFIPFHLQWRQKEHSSFVEYRTKDYCRVKIIYCKVLERFYCSALDVSAKDSLVISN